MTTSHRLCVLGMVATLILTGCGSAIGDWNETEALIAGRFPDVPYISTVELADTLAGPRPEVLLIDARTPEEYAISHLEGAYNAQTAREASRLIETASPDALIVAYCSVGYRSAALVDELQALGIDDAVNLVGSIFAWANEGRAVYRGTERVDEVHPFDESWGLLLDRRFWPDAWP